MLTFVEKLPVELVGMNVLGYLSLSDIVMLERACGSKKSHQLFLDLIPYCTPIALPTSEHTNTSVLDWFANRHCKLISLTIKLPGDNPCLHVKNLQVLHFDLEIDSETKIENLKHVLSINIVYHINSIQVYGNSEREIMEQLCACFENVEQLNIKCSNNCNDWVTVDILSRWKLKEISIKHLSIPKSIMTLIVQTCSELTSIKLVALNIDDSVVINIAQHCPKLETLIIHNSQLTYKSLLALSERELPLIELDIPSLLKILTIDIARRCSNVLSCIRNMNTFYLPRNGQDASIVLPYLTGLTNLQVYKHLYVHTPLLIQHCNKLTKIDFLTYVPFTDISSLCRANPQLQELFSFASYGITDTTLIELIHACPHLHTLRLPHDTDITDTGILALSEYCTQLQKLVIRQSHKVTEVAVLQLLQRCRKLTRLEVSSSSLSEETWTQLDKNTQKRVIRW